MQLTGKITKQDTDQQLIFGWANVVADENGAVVDSQGDVISAEELENAAYDFMLNSRAGGEMHEVTGVATVIESMVFTPEKIKMLGLEEGALPQGWWIGMKVTDDEVWQKIKSGAYSCFSIGGRATREEITND